MPNLNDPDAWQEQDLLGLIGSIQENLNLDYKRSDDLKNRNVDAITKDVSALANSAGGLIIYGLIEERKTRYARQLDGGVDMASMSAETLENILTSNIRPRIDGLRVFPIELTSSASHFAYVVSVPQSSTAHQASDRRYYKRFEFKSEPMYDHEIRDVMNRQKYPRLNLYITHNDRVRSSFMTKFTLNIIMHNSSVVRAREWKVEFWLPAHIIERHASGFAASVASDPPCERLLRFDFFQTSYRSTDTLFPGDQRAIADPVHNVMHLAIPYQDLSSTEEEHMYWIVWRAFADNAPPQVHEVDLKKVRHARYG